jgi:hypothetical protein
MGQACSTNGRREECKLCRTELRDRHRRRWKDSTEMGLKTQDMYTYIVMWIAFVSVRIETSEHGNEPSGSIQGG